MSDDIVERLNKAADRAKAAVDHDLHEGLTVEFAQMAQYCLAEAADLITRLRAQGAEGREALNLAKSLGGVKIPGLRGEASSPGEPVGWFWRWASSDEWRALSRSGTEAGRADFVRDQEKIAPVVIAQLSLATPPDQSRVERLEAALTKIVNYEGSFPASTVQSIARQALHGDRS